MPGAPETGWYPHGFLKRVSWGAIFAGAVVTLVIELALSLLGMGIGLGVVSPVSQENPVGTIGTGAGIWMLITAIIALFIGSWIAARLAAFPRKSTGLIHGLVVWGVVTLFSFYLMTTTVGTLISGAASLIGRGVNLTGAASQLTRGVPDAQTAQQAMSAMSKAAIWAFVGLVISAIAAALGGRAGAPTEPGKYE
ncbi:MAG TPA: hypothetical protein VF790_00465 [Dissulfurispiraceae bacterium]